MNRMKHFISFLLVVALGSFSFKANAYTERNMLQKAADETTLKSVLVMKQAWVPYPAYTDRAAWDSLMGPNKQRLIAAGEKLLDYKWQLIPATAYFLPRFLLLSTKHNHTVLCLQDPPDNLFFLILSLHYPVLKAVCIPHGLSSFGMVHDSLL